MALAGTTPPNSVPKRSVFKLFTPPISFSEQRRAARSPQEERGSDDSCSHSNGHSVPGDAGGARRAARAIPGEHRGMGMEVTARAPSPRVPSSGLSPTCWGSNRFLLV